MELHVRSCLGCVHSECLRLQFHWRRCFDATIRDRETHRFEAGLVLLMMITSRRSSLTTKKWDYYQRGRQEAALLDRCCRSWNEEMQTSHRKILAATMKLELQRRSPAGVSAVLFGAFRRVGMCFLGERSGRICRGLTPAPLFGLPSLLLSSIKVQKPEHVFASRHRHAGQE